MTLGVLYIKGEGVRNVTTCDHCERLITDDEYEQSVALHCVEKSIPSHHIAQVWFVHDECAALFILQACERGDRWFLARAGSLGEAFMTWEEVEVFPGCVVSRICDDGGN